MNDIPWDDPYLEIHAAEDLEPPTNPLCPICGAEMAITRLEPGETIWHCDGQLHRGSRAPLETT